MPVLSSVYFGPRPWQLTTLPSAHVDRSVLPHWALLPSSHQAPPTLGLTSPTFACEKPATNPGAVLPAADMSFSSIMAATPLLSPVTRVLLLYRLVPCTAYHVMTADTFKSDARVKRRSVIVVSVSPGYLARSSAGLAR